MTKFKNTPIGKCAAAIAYVLLLFAASYSVCDGAGIWSTLPLTLLLPPTATLLCDRKRMTVLLCGLCSFVFCLTDGSTLFDAVGRTIVAVLAASLGMLLKRLAVTAVVNPAARRFCSATAILGLLFGIASYAAFFGNPFGALAAGKQTAAYLVETYGDTAPTVETVWYSPRERRYFSRCSFTTQSGSLITAQVVCDKNGVSDGFRNYYEHNLLSERRDTIESFLATRFSAGDYALRVGSIDETVPLYDDSSVEETAQYMRFDIAFTEAVADEKTFAERCERYRNALSDGGIAYDSITFYGGIADSFYYRLTCDAAGTEPLTEADVQPFDEAGEKVES